MYGLRDCVMQDGTAGAVALWWCPRQHARAFAGRPSGVTTTGRENQVVRALVAYATSEGQTAQIAGQIRETIEQCGYPCDLYDVTQRFADSVAVDAYQAVVVGSSIHYGKHDTRIRGLVRQYARHLRRVPSAFFSVCLAVASSNHEDRHAALRLTDEFLDSVCWTPTLRTTFAGALRYSRYGWLTGRLMQRIASQSGAETTRDRDYEYTDWSDVDRFARQFAEVLSPPRSGVADPRMRSGKPALATDLAAVGDQSPR
jgi:menaquinone-dependent protoporphyrinogen oxidase